MSDSQARSFESLTADQIALVNEACDRFEQAWRAGTAPSIREFLDATPSDVHQVLLHELVLLDAHCRGKRGASLGVEDYQRLFPDVDREWFSENIATHGSPRPPGVTAAPPKLARYEIVKEAGRGGMGIVYQARDLRLGRLVCLKSLHPQEWEQPERLARFHREARALGSLNHPNICTIHELEEQNGIPVLVFEWVEGKTFRQLAQEGVRLSQLNGLFLQTAKALAAAHQAGIIHRDVKPENLMVRSDGLVKVLDFGLARREDRTPLGADAGDGQTVEGTLLGTARYMSPEQALGRQATPASDVFSLGIVLYELATERRPFVGSHLAAILNAIVEVDPPPAANINAAIDPRLATLIGRMLEKRPDARPTAAEIVALLEEAQVVRDEDLNSATVSLHSDDLRLVGREVELRELQRALDETEQSRGKAVLVSGEPGIGKTTLVERFVDATACRQRFLVLQGRCSQRLSASDAYLPVLDAISRTKSGPDRELVQTALATAGPAWQAMTTSSTDALARVTAEGGQLSQGRLKREFRAWLEALSRERPVLLFLDDLHWADESTVDLLSYLGQDLASMRVLLLGTYRPADSALANPAFERLRRDLASRGRSIELELPFLGEAAIVEYLQQRFAGHRFPGSFAEFLHGRTEGNPLFLDGILRLLQDQRILAFDGDRWSLTEDPQVLGRTLPDTIHHLLESLLNQLSMEDRQLLQVGGVQGVDFDGAVVADALALERADVEERLQRVAQTSGLIGGGGELEYPNGTLTLRHRFVHVLYHEALYAATAPARRAAWSLDVAAALTSLYGGRSGEIALELAFLYEAGRNFPLAVERLQQAAQRDMQIGACREAATACRRGLELLARLPESSERDQKELSLQFACGFAESLSRGYGSRESLVAYQRAETLCLRQPAAAEGFSVLHGLWAYHLAKMDGEKLATLGKRLVEFAEELASPPYRFAANASMAIVLLHQGELQQAESFLGDAEAACDYALADDRRFVEQMCMPFGPLFHSARSWLRQLQGRSDEALAEAEQAAAWGDALGTPQFQVHSWYALLYYLRGEAEPALAWARKMLEFARRVEFGSYLLSGTILEAWAAVQLADGEENAAAETLDAAVAMLKAQRQSGIRASTPGLLVMIGEAQARLGRAAEAQAAFAEALAYGRETGERWWEAETLRQMGLLAESACGDLPAAAERFAEGLALARSQGAVALQRRCQADVDRLLSSRGGS